MQKRTGYVMAVLLAGCVGQAPDLGSNIEDIQLKGGKDAVPTFTDLGVQLLAEGGFTGVGNKDLLIELDAVGWPTVLCDNHAGFAAPGVNPASVDVSATATVSASEVKNGWVAFSLETAAPAPMSWSDAGCPSAQWTANISDVAFSTATLTVWQAGKIVFQHTYSL
jgi:hypothetical protein